MYKSRAKQLERRIENDPKLRVLETPETGSDSVKVAAEIWELYDKDYSLSVSDISRILDCDAKWVYDNVVRSVEHIFLNYYMRKFAYEQRPNPDLPFLTNFYYFSRTDFKKWLHENTISEIKTVLVNRNEVDPEQMLKFETPYYNHRNEHESVHIRCPLPAQFYRLKAVAQELDIGSNERVYRHLFNTGAIKHTILDSLVRYSPSVIKRTIAKDEICIWADEVQSYVPHPKGVHTTAILSQIQD